MINWSVNLDPDVTFISITCSYDFHEKHHVIITDLRTDKAWACNIIIVGLIQMIKYSRRLSLKSAEVSNGCGLLISSCF